MWTEIHTHTHTHHTHEVLSGCCVKSKTEIHTHTEKKRLVGWHPPFLSLAVSTPRQYYLYGVNENFSQSHLVAMKLDKYLLANLGHRYRHAHRRFFSVRRRPTPPAPQNGSKSTFARPVSPLCVCDICPPRAEVYLVPYSRQFAVEGGVAQQLEEVGRRKPKDKLAGNIIFWSP